MPLDVIRLSLFILITEFSRDVRSADEFINVLSQLDGYAPKCKDCILLTGPPFMVFGTIFVPNKTEMKQKNHFFSFEYCPYHVNLRGQCAYNSFAWAPICKIQLEYVVNDCKRQFELNKKCFCEYAHPHRFFSFPPVDILKSNVGPYVALRLRYGGVIPEDNAWDMANTIKIEDMIARGDIKYIQQRRYSMNFATVAIKDTFLVLAATVMALVLPTWYGAVGV